MFPATGTLFLHVPFSISSAIYWWSLILMARCVGKKLAQHEEKQRKEKRKCWWWISRNESFFFPFSHPKWNDILFNYEKIGKIKLGFSFFRVFPLFHFADRGKLLKRKTTLRWFLRLRSFLLVASLHIIKFSKDKEEESLDVTDYSDNLRYAI